MFALANAEPRVTFRPVKVFQLPDGCCYCSFLGCDSLIGDDDSL